MPHLTESAYTGIINIASKFWDPEAVRAPERTANGRNQPITVRPQKGVREGDYVEVLAKAVNTVREIRETYPQFAAQVDISRRAVTYNATGQSGVSAYPALDLVIWIHGREDAKTKAMTGLFAQKTAPAPAPALAQTAPVQDPAVAALAAQVSQLTALISGLAAQAQQEQELLPSEPPPVPPAVRVQ